jgi:hypothetical protein
VISSRISDLLTMLLEADGGSGIRGLSKGRDDGRKPQVSSKSNSVATTITSGLLRVVPATEG